MTYNFTGLSITANNKISAFAAKLFSKEIEKRTGILPEISDSTISPVVELCICENNDVKNKDSYVVEELGESTLKISALGIRGLIYGYSHFLRKTVYNGNTITLIQDISGKYSPEMQIRGHQLGYRTTPNTYDAWSPEEYFRYFLDLMYFGVNTCELIPPNSVDEKGEPRNDLMKMGFMDMLTETIDIADKLDLDISLWYPNDSLCLDESLEVRREMFKRLSRVDALFIPGGDPGKYPATEFIDRVCAISKVFKEYFPDSKVWPSAQAPHEFPAWGEEFIKALENEPDEIDGIIMGPNHALPIEELRRRVPSKYPLRLYNDITHNVRCEYPVHFSLDDWHYSLASVNGRESVNPRPTEFRTLHQKTSRYIIGSCSYSEGVTDDLNKMLWSGLDFSSSTPLYEILCDYSRVFFPGVSAEKVANAILGLELNWVGDAAENPHIETTLEMWKDILNSKLDLIDNWRFAMHLFRAECDALARRRRCFENSLVREAELLLKKNDFSGALEVLNTDYDVKYKNLRKEIFELADRLFNQIGLQLDVEHYLADNSERGAVLDTLDQPVSNRLWLMGRIHKSLELDESERIKFIDKVLNRNKVGNGEFYFSVAEHGLEVLNSVQENEIYQNFLGDRPSENNGSLPTCVLKVFDSWTFSANLGGFAPNTNYKLRITYSNKPNRKVEHHQVIANQTVLYDGTGYGGMTDSEFDDVLIPKRFVTATYDLPSKLFENGCLSLKIAEPTEGFELCEFWVIKA